MSATIYAGPAKVYRGLDTTVVGGATGAGAARAFQAEGEMGNVVITLLEDTVEYAAGMFGRIGEQSRDQIIEITFRPFDSWFSVDQLFPPWVGITTNASAGVLSIGGRPFALTGSYVGTKVWTPDGRLYNIFRTAVTGHPSMHLGVGKALFGDAKITGLWNETVAVGTTPSSNLMAITETAGSEPVYAFTLSDFVRGPWTGVWGTVAGFGGAAGSAGGGATPMQAEDEWTVEITAKYSPLKVQGRTLNMQLTSVNAMIRFMPYGPSHSDILAAVGIHTQGQRLGAHDLVLTGPSSKVITLVNSEVRGVGFKFGGTTLGTGEVGFVMGQTFTAGAPVPFLTLSA